ncbi:phytanoyl-CoA dioxygenase [Streptomyces sp. NRRL B-1677]|uniref:phytanoyl-CoA dioxygenase family protein n=1 Tax=Streptomyces TaxID=1883 RepID=UPI001892AE98|nr:phytanoyl-CoA dioxygenase family protein [Streptomyces sp. NRRL B-1677]MBF6046071.1 phytanoyl-CoA dioxygenase [Streptomyces sp. NRRL B-1677]
MPPVVSSQGLPLDLSDRTLFAPGPMRDGAHLLGRPDAARERLAAEGCLYLRGVLARAEVLRLREAYFAACDPVLLAPGTAPREGVFSGRVPPGLPPHGVPGHPAYAFVRSETFRRFLASPALTAVAGALLGGPAVMLPRRILRHFHRGARTASRAHTDRAYLDRGTDRVLTLWIPLGDCPPATGGLVYLEGSHALSPASYASLRAGADRPHDRRPISHDLARTARALGRRWLWADYAAGDVTAHLPHIVHASLDTRTAAMRLSVDVRFVRRGDRADPRWLRDWAGDDGF